MNRVQQKNIQSEAENNSIKTFKKQNFLYVCLHGVPPYDDEFVNLLLPGEILLFRYTYFGKNQSGEEMLS